MKTTRSIRTKAHTKEKRTIRVRANCIAWFFKLRNISQVTIKRVDPICIVVSVKHVALNRSYACALFVKPYKSVLLKSYTIAIKDLSCFTMQKGHFTKHLSPELVNLSQQIDTCSK